jgi:hypothetical protein
VALEKPQARKWFSKIAPLPQGQGRADLDRSSAGGGRFKRAIVSDLTIVPSIGAEADALGSSIRDAALFCSGRPVMPRIVQGPIGAKDKRIKLVSVT